MFQRLMIRPFVKPDFYIETNDRELVRCLDISYSPNISSNTKQDNSYIITAMIQDHICQLIDGENVKHIFKENVLQEIENIIYIQSKVINGIFGMHAACIEKDDKAFIICGNTEAGKTTLTTFLCYDGFSYITDDMTFLNQQSCKVCKSFNPIMLRPTSMDVLRKYGVYIHDFYSIKWGNIQRYVFTPYVKDSDNLEVAGIFFIERTMDSNRIVRLDNATAFLYLMKSLIYYWKHDAASIRFIKRLVENGCYRLSYSNMDFASNVLHKIGEYHG